MSIFNYYPYIEYNGIKGTHILNKIEVIRSYLDSYQRFYNYTIKENERADIIAYKEYGDASLDWIIYLVNGVTDPYADWIMDDKNFISYLENKYNTKAEKLASPLINSSIVYYYYKGIPSDTPEDIASYNYTMAPETYDYKAAISPLLVTGWEPKTVWDYESELNEAKREIKLLRPQYISEFKQQFKDIMNAGLYNG